MKIEETSIEGMLLITPQRFADERGYFMETYHHERYAAHTSITQWVQENESFSGYGVLRGFSFQRPPYTQAKLVRVVVGKVLDVVLDLRKYSRTFGKYVMTDLSDVNYQQVLIPYGCAHAFLVLSDKAIVQYKVDNPYVPEAEDGVRFDDEALNICWPISSDKIIISAKDKARPLLNHAFYFEGKK